MSRIVSELCGQTVSMPFFGLTPFLHYKEEKLCSRKHVSMPFFGLTPFLRIMTVLSTTSLMCQCPSSGLLHFYVIKTDAYKRVEECVNALLRAYSISTKITKSNSGNQTMCQCPSSGLLHFYGTLWEPSVYAASQTHFCK